MKPDLEADTEALRRDAAALTGIAARLGETGPAPVPDPAPRWLVTTAAEPAATTAQRLLGQLGAGVEATARQIREAAEAYEQADARAAARLRPAR
jgi:hypothetical protein